MKRNGIRIQKMKTMVKKISGKTKRTALISLLILAIAAAIIIIIFSTEPKAEKQGATRKTAMLVNIIKVDLGDYVPEIKAVGRVTPSRDITLSPRVSGQVTAISDAFVPGGHIRKGKLLLRIDPADYENMLQQRLSELGQGRAELKIEMGRQNVAEQDFRLLEDTSISQKNRSLILRQPQLESAEARVKFAEAAVKRAELDLKRTAIKAPFDAHILSRYVNVGSQVAPGQDLGRLVGTDEYWVEVTVPLSKMKWIELPGEDEKYGSEVKIINRTAWEKGEFRTGYIYKLIGTLEEETRMARLLVAVPDPLGYHSSQEVPPLIIGAFVQTIVQGKKINNVVRISRDYIRKDETVWVMTKSKLQIRNVDITFRDARYAYISSGINDGDSLITTNLSVVAEGAKLRLDTARTDTTENKNGEGMR